MINSQNKKGKRRGKKKYIYKKIKNKKIAAALQYKQDWVPATGSPQKIWAKRSRGWPKHTGDLKKKKKKKITSSYNFVHHWQPSRAIIGLGVSYTMVFLLRPL